MRITTWVATLDGYVNAQISPQVIGYIIAQDYKEGSYVQKGQTLFRIDPGPFQAILDQAKAQLAQAEAQMGKTQLDVDRDIGENKHCGRVKGRMASHPISFSARSNRSETRRGRRK